MHTLKTSKKHPRLKRTKKASRVKTSLRKSREAVSSRVPSQATSSTTITPLAAPVWPAPATAAAQTTPASRTTDREWVGVAILGVVVAAAVAVALVGYPSPSVSPSVRNTSGAGRTQSEALSQPVHIATPAAIVAPARIPKADIENSKVEKGKVEKSTVEKSEVESRKPTPAVAARNSVADSVSSPAAVMAAVVARPPAPEFLASEQSTAPVATTDSTNQGTTISGCLESTVDEDQFRLTDIDGANAPKARSWRSGFLKRRSTPVELVELSDVVALRRYVGHRVTATGVLTGRQLRVHSVTDAGSSCD